MHLAPSTPSLSHSALTPPRQLGPRSLRLTTPFPPGPLHPLPLAREAGARRRRRTCYPATARLFPILPLPALHPLCEAVLPKHPRSPHHIKGTLTGLRSPSPCRPLSPPPALWAPCPPPVFPHARRLFLSPLPRKRHGSSGFSGCFMVKTPNPSLQPDLPSGLGTGRFAAAVTPPPDDGCPRHLGVCLSPLPGGLGIGGPLTSPLPLSTTPRPSVSNLLVFLESGFFYGHDGGRSAGLPLPWG